MGLFQVVHTITLTLPHHLTSDELQELEELTFAHFLAREGADPNAIKHADWPITLKTVTSQHLVHPGGSSNSSSSSRRASPKGPRARTSSRGSSATSASKSSNGPAIKEPSPVPTKVPSVAVAAEDVPVRPSSRAPAVRDAASAVPSIAREKTAVPSVVVTGGRPSSHISAAAAPVAEAKAASRAPTVIPPSKPVSIARAPSKAGTVVPDQSDSARPTSRPPSAAGEKPTSKAPSMAAAEPDVQSHISGDKPLPRPPTIAPSRPPSVAPSNALGLRFSPLPPQAPSVVASGGGGADPGASRAASRAASVVGGAPKALSIKDDSGSVVTGGGGGSKVLSPIREALTPAPAPAPAPSVHGSVPQPKAASVAGTQVPAVSRQPSVAQLAQEGRPPSAAASGAAHELRPPSVRAPSAPSVHGNTNKTVVPTPAPVPHTDVERGSTIAPIHHAHTAEQRQSFPPGRQVVEEFTTLEISLKAEWGEDALGTARIKELVSVCLSELEMMARRLEQKKNAVDNAPMAAIP